MNAKLLLKDSPLLIIAIISALITGAMFYFEEGRHNFGFLTTGEITNFLVFLLLVSIIPIIIYFLTKQSKYSRQSIYIAIAGYIPALLLLLKMH
jgi:uncharacterized membrane protein